MSLHRISLHSLEYLKRNTERAEQEDNTTIPDCSHRLKSDQYETENAKLAPKSGGSEPIDAIDAVSGSQTSGADNQSDKKYFPHLHRNISLPFSFPLPVKYCEIIQTRVSKLILHIE